MSDAGTGGIDFLRLEAHLKVLAYANRLELLSLLRKPKTLDEIRLTPGVSQAGESADRPISRQAVQNHVDQLVEAGVIRVGKTDRKGKRSVNEYVLDQARLFAVLEELRKVGTFAPFVTLDPFTTEGIAESKEADWEPGPKLVLVHGVHEGRSFALKPSQVKPPRGWVVGRGTGVHVSLDYDPYVSSENAEVLKTPNGWRLLDLRSAKNGTFLNWKRVPVGGEVPLRGGDVVGVGRSFLVFRED